MVLAVVFDLQGTCADFYRPVLRAGADVDPAVDWGALVVEWRRLYRERMTAPEPSCDLNVADFVELAEALGC